MSINVLTLKFLSFIIDLLPDMDLTGIPVIENISDLTNIFAWINFFVPTTALVALIGITSTFYVFRGFYTILKDFVF